MRRPFLFSAALSLTSLVSLAAATPAHAQEAHPTGALERFEPSAPGDAFFGVPSPSVGGHLVPRAVAVFDYASRPLSVQGGAERFSVVARQGILHLGASLALFDRLLVSADMPLVLLQGGDSPTVSGITFPSPSSAQAGDLRLGARARIIGGFWDPFQLGVGGLIFVPTAPGASYAGDGAVRGEPQLLLGGRLPHFVWSLGAGATLRASSHPHTFDARAGAALVLGEDLLQLGPELSVAVPFSKDLSFSSAAASISTATSTAAELLLGAKLRPFGPLVIGAGAGPGLTHGYGTPVFFAVGSLGYEPLPPRAADRDSDGISDADDACPDVRGVRSDDPAKNGCPADRDRDGILDTEDACPDVPGVKSDDPKKNGCPVVIDRDGDGILDEVDACPEVRGVKSDDPKKNGCPAAPPPDDDRDHDGIPDTTDACPDVKGGPDPDPKQNGCPHVQVTPTEIAISKQVKFRFARAEITQTVDPVSDSLLGEVKGAIDDHPEIELIEVQGHTDDVGPEDYNLLLSKNRAEAVRAWLIGHGVPAAKLTIRGFGSRAPIAPNTSEAGRQENRRVQFLIIKRGQGR